MKKGPCGGRAPPVAHARPSQARPRRDQLLHLAGRHVAAAVLRKWGRGQRMALNGSRRNSGQAPPSRQQTFRLPSGGGSMRAGSAQRLAAVQTRPHGCVQRRQRVSTRRRRQNGGLAAYQGLHSQQTWKSCRRRGPPGGAAPPCRPRRLPSCPARSAAPAGRRCTRSVPAGQTAAAWRRARPPGRLRRGAARTAGGWVGGPAGGVESCSL